MDAIAGAARRLAEEVTAYLERQRQQQEQQQPVPDDRHEPQIARVAPDLYAVHDFYRGKVFEGSWDACHKELCCLNYEAELRVRAAAKYPVADRTPELESKIERKIEKLLAEYRAAQLPDPPERTQARSQGRGLSPSR